jgi:hypothetical protein
MGIRPWKEVRPLVVTDPERVAAYGAEMEAVIARYQRVANQLLRPDHTEDDLSWLVAELDDWAPYRRAATSAMLDGEDTPET